MRVLALLPVVLLTGCGVAGAQFHPGVAAQVGDETITSRHLDQVSADYCSAVEKVSKGQPQAGGSQTPMRYLTHTFGSALITQAAVEQLADEYGVEPSSTYKGALAELEPQLTKLTDDEKDAVREVFGAERYNDDVLTQIGEISLKKQGTSNATADDQLAEGHKVLDAWVADHDVRINPKYAIDLGSDGPVDTDLSYALGDTAKNGMAAQPDPGYTAALPGDMVCLD